MFYFVFEIFVHRNSSWKIGKRLPASLEGIQLKIDYIQILTDDITFFMVYQWFNCTAIPGTKWVPDNFLVHYYWICNVFLLNFYIGRDTQWQCKSRNLTNTTKTNPRHEGWYMELKSDPWHQPHARYSSPNNWHGQYIAGVTGNHLPEPICTRASTLTCIDNKAK